MTGADAKVQWEWRECAVPPAEPAAALVAEIRRTSGHVPAWVTRIGPCPWVARASAAFTARPLAFLPLALWDLVSLVVSRDNSCRFCYGAQRAFMRILGYREADLDRIERDLHAAGLSSADVAALEFARRVSHANPRPTADDLAALMRAGFSRQAVAELAFAAAITVYANRLSTLLALPTERFVEQVDRPAMRVLRPLVAWWLAPKLRPPEPLPDPNPPPCAAVVAALEGSPAARVLRRAIDEAMASPLLPRRTKLFVLAVVARGVGCGHGEAEARAGLAALGLAAATVDDVLDHLSAPALDACEARLVPFARETVRYHQPAALQERFRTAVDGLPHAVVVEAAGTLALANAVCRLSVLLDRC